MIHSLRKITALICLVSSLGFGTVEPTAKTADNSTNLQLYAQSAILMDAGSGRILYEKNSQEVRPMASTTKIMTCILALECGNPEDYVPVSAYAASMPKVKLGVSQGEYYQLKDLLYSLMLESHNDSAVVIAEYIGGSVEGFADMMNQKARDIGCFNTFFITPNGLDATATGKGGVTKTHSTTAEDLAKIMSYCIMESPMKEQFLEITQKQSYSFVGYREKDGEIVTSGRSFQCSNHNAFLTMMDGALSGKTGFTGNAGYCYVGALERDGRTYVVALLACGWPNNKGYKWSDTKKLMTYGIENFVIKKLSDVEVDEEGLSAILVSGGQTKEIGGIAYVPVEIADRKEEDGNGTDEILMRQEEEITVVCKQKETLQAPVIKGTEVGEIRYQVGDETFRIDYIVTKEDVDIIDFNWCMKQILQRYSL